MLGRTRDAWTGLQTEVEGTVSEFTSHVMESGGVGARKPGGVAEAKIVSRRARPLVVIGGGSTRLEVRVDGADAEADAKRVSRVTLPFVWVGAGEADGISLEKSQKRNLQVM